MPSRIQTEQFIVFLSQNDRQLLMHDQKQIGQLMILSSADPADQNHRIIALPGSPAQRRQRVGFILHRRQHLHLIGILPDQFLLRRSDRVKIADRHYHSPVCLSADQRPAVRADQIPFSQRTVLRQPQHDRARL